MSNQQAIIRHLFNKETLDDVSLETLEQFAGEHPLFGAGQFLLARKYQQTGNASFEQQVQKAALYFSDPLWLHYQLTSSLQEQDISPAIAPDPKSWEPSPVIYDTPEESTGAEDKDSSLSTPAPENSEPASASHDMIEEVVNNQEAVFETRLSEEQPFAMDTDVDEVFIDTVGISAGSISGNGQTAEEKPEHTAFNETSLVADPQVVNPDVTEKENVSSSTSAVPVDAPRWKHPLFPGKGDDEEPENKITFEPFHTVDYFASQGIKVSGEIRDDDRLGKQMKSFTEWLKTMRRLPEAKVEAELEKINDREIERLAAHSLDDNEVVTEAMAEVLARQGKRSEAAALYRKLSLLNPAKSAYFAAKIEGLNH